jgi:hypothetical protein
MRKWILCIVMFAVALLSGGCNTSGNGRLWLGGGLDVAALPDVKMDFSPPKERSVRRFSAPLGTASSSHRWSAPRTRRWTYIVVHHSASPVGSAEVFHRQHLARGWDELGYHFVICNGRGGGDGQVQVGPRWAKQKHGAHCGGTPGNEYNEHGIGICLVGDFTNTLPTAAQMKSFRELVDYLRKTYDIPAENVIAHCEAPNAHTECCGQAFLAYLDGTVRPALRTGYAAAK